MRRIEKLPSAFGTYDEMMGVLDFAVFEDATGSEAEALRAIPHALRHARVVDTETLSRLGFRRIDLREFMGDWYDVETGNLLRNGSYQTADGSELLNPALKELDGVKIVSGASFCSEAGAGGQFAYAFSHPPYGLRGCPSRVQAVFEEIRDFILPPVHQGEIWDWSNPRLPDASDYFVEGMEWWGVFLFTIHVPAIRRLTIVAGSTTD